MSSRPLKLISSMATREVLTELASRFQRCSGRAVTSEAAGGVDVAKRVQGGEPMDVVVLAGNAIDKLTKEGRLLTGSRVDLVKSGIAVAVKAGTSRPDITTEEATKSAVLAAKTLSFSTGPSGAYLEKMFREWGIYETIRGRIVVPPPGIAVGSLVAKGTVELGFQQLSELMNLPGIDVVGPLPAAIQSITTFSGAIAAASDMSEAARALLDYMASPAASPVKQQHGMEPA
ncbi:MAG: molybdate transport system substrate-binding protein [Gammaproteobacteria bacterium]|nr:molybdate transport system substrate-binding protein [Gammaproteobacteria bacterium]